MPRNLVPKQHDAASSKCYTQKADNNPDTMQPAAGSATATHCGGGGGLLAKNDVTEEAAPQPLTSHGTITASNALLLASMLDAERVVSAEHAAGAAANGRSTRSIRREVRSARDIDTERAFDHHLASKRPGSSRDIGGETRRRANELAKRESHGPGRLL